MDVFLASIGLIITTILSLPHILFWQLKEYRFDRAKADLLAQLRSRSKISYSITYPLSIFVLLVLSETSTASNSFFTLVQSLCTTFFVFILIRFIFQLNKRKLRRPRISLRNGLIGIFVVGFYIIWNLIGVYQFSISLPITAFAYFSLIPLWVACGVLVTMPFAFISRKRKLYKAEKKLQQLHSLKTIGITGSYGKTTTKEMLTLLLSEKFTVVPTPGNYNTDIGIAQTILSDVTSSTDIFIAEMGAYKKGEIKKAAQLVPLDYAIVTNVGKSHIDIFGSIEEIARAKSEILDGLKDDGVGILNYDNEYTKAMGVNLSNTLTYFSIVDHNHNTKHPLLLIEDISWDDVTVKFTARFNSEKRVIMTRIVGPHNLTNLAAAMSCALSLGISLPEIQSIVKGKIFTSSHFKLHKRKNNVTIINDSYNSNPDGFTAALDFLKSHKKTSTYVVTKGIPEVSKQITTIYNSLVPHIVNTADGVITSDPILYRALKDFSPDYNVTLAKTNEQINIALETLPRKNMCILLEGRLHPDTMTKILHELF